MSEENIGVARKVVLAVKGQTSALSPGGRALARAGLAELDRRLSREEQRAMHAALRKSAKLVRK